MAINLIVFVLVPSAPLLFCLALVAVTVLGLLRASCWKMRQCAPDVSLARRTLGCLPLVYHLHDVFDLDFLEGCLLQNLPDLLVLSRSSRISPSRWVIVAYTKVYRRFCIVQPYFPWLPSLIPEPPYPHQPLCQCD